MDKEILKKQHNIIEREKKIKDDKYFISCPICGERLKRITLWHLKSKHNMSMREFREKYPQQKLNSYMTSMLDKENFLSKKIIQIAWEIFQKSKQKKYLKK